MAEQIKFTEEEINEINQLRQQFTQLFIQLGEVSLDRKQKLEELDRLESELHQRHNELQEIEDKLFKSLNEKYGDGNYDPNTGIFTPSETQQSVTL
jgi:DNA repair ATPase RecN